MRWWWRMIPGPVAPEAPSIDRHQCSAAIFGNRWPAHSESSRIEWPIDQEEIVTTCDCATGDDDRLLRVVPTLLRRIEPLLEAKILHRLTAIAGEQVRRDGTAVSDDIGAHVEQRSERAGPSIRVHRQHSRTMGNPRDDFAISVCPSFVPEKNGPDPIAERRRVRWCLGD